MRAAAGSDQRIVLTNRTDPPDAILREVFERTGDRPFDAIDDVISREELVCAVRGLQAGRRLFEGGIARLEHANR